MSTYTGDPTATQSPSAAPAPGSAPTANLVVDGTAINAASVNQQTKVLADFIAWVMSPRAKAAAGTGTSTWGQAILAFKNSQLFTRFAVDHHGFPAGQIMQWDENWDDASSQVADLTISSNGLLGARWNYRVINGPGGGGLFLGSAGASHAGGTNPYPTSNLYMLVPTVGGPVVSVTAVQLAHAPIVMEPAGGTVISMHWDQSTSLAGLNNSSGGQVAMGIGAPGVTGTNSNTFGVGGGLNPIGAAFVGGEQVGSTNPNNWRAYLNNNGTPQLFDTGVDSNTPNVRRRFRIEVIGAAVSDDATARVLFWIDGALVKSAAIDLTNGGAGVELSPFLRLWGEGNSVASQFGPIRFRANLWPADAFI